VAWGTLDGALPNPALVPVYPFFDELFDRGLDCGLDPAFSVVFPIGPVGYAFP
jgi:hypothetical protein